MRSPIATSFIKQAAKEQDSLPVSPTRRAFFTKFSGNSKQGLPRMGRSTVGLREELPHPGDAYCPKQSRSLPSGRSATIRLLNWTLKT